MDSVTLNNNHKDYKSIKILTDLKARVSTEWKKRTVLAPVGGNRRNLIIDILDALKMLHMSKNYDVVIVTSSRRAHIFSLLSALRKKKKIPILMIDCLWYKPKNVIKYYFKKIQLRIESIAINKFIVWASHEVNDYSEIFNIPKDKFLFVPFHHSLEGFKYVIEDNGYIFSGGDGDRDYVTLIKAVKDLSKPVKIATRLKNWNKGISIPENIEAFPTSQSDFRKWMAGASIVVVPMEAGHLHSGGQQTYLNAMAMGKPLIVADTKGALDYIDNGVNGVIVQSGDYHALNTVLKKLINEPELAKSMSDNGEMIYEKYSTHKCMENILDIAEQLVVSDQIQRI